MKITVAVNERGQRVGDSHPQARLTNGEVDLLLLLRDEGWSYNRLADKFDLSKSGVRNICKGMKRCQCAVAYRVVEVLEVHLIDNND